MGGSIARRPRSYRALKISEVRREEAAERFLRCSKLQYRDASSIYQYLSHRIAGDAELLALAARAPREQPICNLFFAAVKYLGSYAGSPLEDLYDGSSDIPDVAFDTFREFCLDHADNISHLLKTRTVQTNEVGRCALLLPALSGWVRTANPLFVELGASAGLNLAWNQYTYTYQSEYGSHTIDPGASGVHLACKAPEHMPIRRAPTSIEAVGIDVNPLDVESEEDVAWMRALVWPGQDSRLETLDKAIEHARAHPPRLVEGNAVDTLPEVISESGAGRPVIVFHSFTYNQMTPGERESIDRYLKSEASNRRIVRVGIEWMGIEHPELSVTEYARRYLSSQVLAECCNHGSWIRWHN